MHPLQAHHLYDLAAGAHAAATAAQATDDVEQRYGLLAAVESLTGELKQLAWDYVESAQTDEARPRIAPAIARALNPDADLTELAGEIYKATGDALDPDAIKLVMVDEGEAGWLVRDETTGLFIWHVANDGRLMRQKNE